jgi:filamentous hemagglutinin family protein
MSSRLINKKSTGSKNQQSKTQASKKTANKLKTAKPVSNNAYVNKIPAFALSSTAFSVCIALSSYALPAIFNPALAAGPKGGVVVSGSGSISKDAAETIIKQNSQHMAINWESYNVASNERVKYIQPNSQSVSLNNILSSNGSVIAGNIDANGKVILVNPNGIVFTQSSTLNVGSLVASNDVLLAKAA